MLYKKIWLLSDEEEELVLEWLKFGIECGIKSGESDAEQKLVSKVLDQNDEHVYEFGEEMTLIEALLYHLFETLCGQNDESIEWLKERLNMSESQLLELVNALGYE